MQEHFLKAESDCPPLSLPADIALCGARPEVMARKIKERECRSGARKNRKTDRRRKEWRERQPREPRARNSCGRRCASCRKIPMLTARSTARTATRAKGRQLISAEPPPADLGERRRRDSRRMGERVPRMSPSRRTLPRTPRGAG